MSETTTETETVDDFNSNIVRFRKERRDTGIMSELEKKKWDDKKSKKNKKKGAIVKTTAEPVSTVLDPEVVDENEAIKKESSLPKDVSENTNSGLVLKKAMATVKKSKAPVDPVPEVNMEEAVTKSELYDQMVSMLPPGVIDVISRLSTNEEAQKIFKQMTSNQWKLVEKYGSWRTVEINNGKTKLTLKRKPMTPEVAEAYEGFANTRLTNTMPIKERFDHIQKKVRLLYHVAINGGTKFREIDLKKDLKDQDLTVWEGIVFAQEFCITNSFRPDESGPQKLL